MRGPVLRKHLARQRSASLNISQGAKFGPDSFAALRLMVHLVAFKPLHSNDEQDACDGSLLPKQSAYKIQDVPSHQQEFS